MLHRHQRALPGIVKGRAFLYFVSVLLPIVLLFFLLISLGNRTVAQDPVAISDAPTECDGKNFPKTIGGIPSSGSTSCCQAANNLFHVGNGGKGLAHRQLGRPCSLKNSSTRCGIGAALPCYYGPCGAHIVSVIPATAYNILIFRPKSNQQVCGYQFTDSTGAVIAYFPEPFTDQTVFTGVTSTCPYTECLRDGRPAFSFTITTMSGGAKGRVKSAPPGITLSGAGRARRTFAETVTLTAEPTGRHARAVFSGDCVKAGEYGKEAECIVKPAPDPKVTVTYECEKGFTCERGNKD